MKKFFIKSLKGKTSIVEVEVQKASMLNAPNFYGWWSLKEGEYVAHILSPADLKALYPDPVCWWALYETAEEAKTSAERSIRAGYDRAAMKSKTEVDVEKLEKELASIEIVLLK